MLINLNNQNYQVRWQYEYPEPFLNENGQPEPVCKQFPTKTSCIISVGENEIAREEIEHNVIEKLTKNETRKMAFNNAVKALFPGEEGVEFRRVFWTEFLQRKVPTMLKRMRRIFEKLQSDETLAEKAENYFSKIGEDNGHEETIEETESPEQELQTA